MEPPVTEEKGRRFGNVRIERLGRNGYLHGVVPLLDATGNVIDHLVRPLMVEFQAKDVVQTIIGSALLAIPVCYTEEAWNLGATLPMGSIYALAFLSMLFVGIFVYFNFYRGYMKGFSLQFVVRVAATYAISLSVVALMLTILQLAPWDTDPLLAVKRMVVVSFPASMAATVADAIK